MPECAYKISVIMAIYNVEPFLREAIDSVIEQDIGFENIQLILVDDGSPDGSGAICDEYAQRYPENVVVIHKKNGGVSTARNAGLALAKGELVNFLDADDRLSENAASQAYDFFQKYPQKTDVVAIPMKFFGGQHGQHILNTKFKKGTRLIDLDKEWETAQLSASSSFIRAEEICSYRFDSRLAYAEDAHVLQKILTKKCTLGVVSSATYWYRRRNEGTMSAVQSSITNPAWYLPYMRHFQKDTINMCMERYGYVPKFVQYTLMYDLQWRLKQETIPEEVLPAADQQLHMDLIRWVLGYISDEVIAAQKNIFQEHKLFAYQLKYGEKLCAMKRPNNSGILLQSTMQFKISNFPLKLEFLHLEKDCCKIEGMLSYLPLVMKDVHIYAEMNNERYNAELYTERKSGLSMNTEIQKRTAFHVSIPLAADVTEGRITLGCTTGSADISLTNIRFGNFFPVSSKNINNYYIQNGWIISTHANELLLRREEAGSEVACLRRLCRELWKRNGRADRKSVIVRFALRILKPFKRRKLWLISDQIEKAGDNGEAFFRYMCKEHPEINTIFVIKKDSPDYRRMRKIGPVVNRGGYWQKLLLLMSDCVISSAGEIDVYNPFFYNMESYRNLTANLRFVFLQHGITKDDISDWVGRSKKNFSGFVTAAIPEYNSIAGGKYEYNEDVVWLTGFPRFDRLYNDCQKKIAIMPTWRKYLVGDIDVQTGKRKLAPNAAESEYVTFYNALINNERLLTKAKDLGYQICFMPHPAFQHHPELFVQNSQVQFLGREAEYRDVFATSDLLITDYSSTVFDFVYLRKPVFYTQFDSKTFFSGAHTYQRGYFDYERDGFGEVEYTLEGTIDRIIEYMENGCIVKDEYRQRIDQFFAFNDQNNCQRVYEKIVGIDT